MRLRWTFLLLIFVAVFPALAAGQQVDVDQHSPVHQDTLNIFEDQPHQLRPFVLIHSEDVRVNDQPVDTTDYRIDYRHGHLWLDVDPPGGDATLTVSYRTLPFTFRDVYSRHRVIDTTEAVAQEATDPDAWRQLDEDDDEQSGFTLSHSGSLSRGVRTGSHRDMRVDSGLRMEFSGEVADEIYVRGTLTDEDTPIQPDGSTQRLRDVDRVNLKIASPNASMQLGDFDLALNGSHFAQLNRRVQGVVLEADDHFGLSYVPQGSELTVAAVQNRGTYRQQEIQPLDGVQGPYQLRGAQGERFIVVMAGSEQIYLDGQLLQRGDQQDYTIDYTTGEIWFTADHLITDDRRITAEFEYTTGERNRTVVASQARVAPWQDGEGRERLQVGATVLRAADGAGQFADFPGQDALVPGPDGTMIRSGATSVTFDPEAPYAQYRVDRTERADSVFVPLTEAPAEGDEVYRVRFSHVGEGQGSYRRDPGAVNAIRYDYAGEGGGAYAPIMQLAAPQEHQVVDLHGSFEIMKGVELFGEWAHSGRNQNRLISDPALTEDGQAYRGGVRLDEVGLNIGGTSLGNLSAGLLRHHQSSSFETLERTRHIEFGRRWNLPGAGPYTGASTTDVQGEDRDEFQIEWMYSPGLRVSGEVGRLQVPGMYDSRRQASELRLPVPGGGEAYYDVERIASMTAGHAEASRWIRHHGGVSTTILSDRLEPGVSVRREEREMRTEFADSLAAASFRFTEVTPFLGWNLSEGWRVGAETSYREESRMQNARLVPALTSVTSYATLEVDQGNVFSMNGRLGYRMREAESGFDQHANRSLLMRSQIQYRPLDRAIDLSLRHEARTERTPVMQELFLRTGPELGTYVWEDENDDGIIQVDEMIPERTPGEAMYARRMVPTDSLVPVTHVEARIRLHIDPHRLLRGRTGGLAGALRNVESRTLVDLREQTRSLPSARLYMLDPREILQSGQTQRGRVRLSQDLIFLRRHRALDFSVGYNRNQSIEDRSADSEWSLAQEWQADFQVQPAAAWSIRLRSAIQQDARVSSSFNTRSYNLEGWRARPEVTFHAGVTSRVTAGLFAEQLWDREIDREALRISVPVQIRLARAGRLQVTGEADVGHIRLEGDAGGLSRFRMTDGRGAGTSARWSLLTRYQLTEMLHLTFNYNGLAAQETPVRNTFQVELTAQF